MSNIFSTVSHTTAKGQVVAIPRGVSVSYKSGREGIVHITIRINHTLSSVEVPVHELDLGLYRAVSKLVSAIKAGATPGGYNTVKRKTAPQEYPVGVSMYYADSTKDYRMVVSYPDVKQERIRYMSYYVGNEETYFFRHDRIAKTAIRLRKVKLIEYRKEFLIRAKLALKQLKP